MPRIPYEIKPGDGCPGYTMANGRTLGLCITCTRLGGNELEPAANVNFGEARCPNFHPLSVGSLNGDGQTADVGGQA